MAQRASFCGSGVECISSECAVDANVLFHIVLSCKGRVTDRALDALFASVLLAMASGVAGRCECRGAAVVGGVGTGIFDLSACAAGRSNPGRGRF